ncbi:MAG: hypothetical protein AB7I27_16000 [Bacteriovoracaceae bacterium]
MKLLKVTAAALSLIVSAAFAKPVLVGNEVQNNTCEVTVVEHIVKATVFKPQGGICTRTFNLNAEAVANILKTKGYKPVVAKAGDDIKDGLIVYGGIQGTYLPTSGWDSCLVHIVKSHISVGYTVGTPTNTENYTYNYGVLIQNEGIDLTQVETLSTKSSRGDRFSVADLPNCVEK